MTDDVTDARHALNAGLSGRWSAIPVLAKLPVLNLLLVKVHLPYTASLWLKLTPSVDGMLMSMNDDLHGIPLFH